MPTLGHTFLMTTREIFLTIPCSKASLDRNSTRTGLQPGECCLGNPASMGNPAERPLLGQALQMNVWVS